MDFLKRIFGGKPANAAPLVANTGATAPLMPSSGSTNSIVGGRRTHRRRNQRRRQQTRRGYNSRNR